MSHFAPIPKIPAPSSRYLRVFSVDPALAQQVDRLQASVATLQVRWSDLEDESGFAFDRVGLSGKYFEIIDYDQPSRMWYPHLNLNDPAVLNSHGLEPSEADPRFHQQMVYAVAMKTVETFEAALGRWVLWSNRKYQDEDGDLVVDYVDRLRIYPHAMRLDNAFYDPDRKAILFGYFPQGGSTHLDRGSGYLVFSCLSFDIISHETTHAILDGIYEYFIEDTNPDVLAFHEAISDIVALFQRFSLPELLRHQIAETRGDLNAENLLAQLAVQFGMGVGRPSALRDAIGEYVDRNGEVIPETALAAKINEAKWQRKRPNSAALNQAKGVHARGAILVSAVFDAFLLIYHRHTEDLIRIATEGTGILRPGNLHPDLVQRLAEEAAKVARRVLQMCIRALDFVAPVDVTFGEFLRAVITADKDVVDDDYLGYRVAFVQAFRGWGILPPDVKTLGTDNLVWQMVVEQLGESSLSPDAYVDITSHEPVPAAVLNEWTAHFRIAITDMVTALRMDICKESTLRMLMEKTWFQRLKPYQRASLLVKLMGQKKELARSVLDYFKAEQVLTVSFGDENSDSDSKPKLLSDLMRPMSQREKHYHWSEAAGYLLRLHLEKDKPAKNQVRQGNDGLQPKLSPLNQVIQDIFGIEVTNRQSFQVHSVLISRRTPINIQMRARNELVIRLMQKVYVNPETMAEYEDGEYHDGAMQFRGGCTILFDLDEGVFRYVIRKSVGSTSRRKAQALYQANKPGSNYRTPKQSLREIHGA